MLFDVLKFNKPRLVFIVKEIHKYYFLYERGNERQLYLAMISCGKNEDTDVSLIEVLHMVRKMSESMRDGKDEAIFFNEEGEWNVPNP